MTSCRAQCNWSRFPGDNPLYHAVTVGPGRYHRAMVSDRELAPVPDARAAGGAGQEAVAAELLARIRAELPVVAAMGQRE